MIASYLLSRTLVPTLARCSSARGAEALEDDGTTGTLTGTGATRPAARRREAALGGRPVSRAQRLAAPRVRAAARRLRHALEAIDASRAGSCSSPLALRRWRAASPAHGRRLDFFPAVDAGVRCGCTCARPSARASRTPSVIVDAVEREIRQHHPARRARHHQRQDRPSASSTTSPSSRRTTSAAQDAEILDRARAGPPADAGVHPDAFAPRAPRRVPRRRRLYFMPADVVTQVLNFGLPAPIDVQIESRDNAVAVPLARQLERRDPQHPRHRGRAHRAGARPPGAAARRRPRSAPLQLGADQRDVAHEPAHVARRRARWSRRTSGSNPDNRRQLHRRRPDAALADGARVDDLMATPITARPRRRCSPTRRRSRPRTRRRRQRRRRRWRRRRGQGLATWRGSRAGVLAVKSATRPCSR